MTDKFLTPAELHECLEALEAPSVCQLVAEVLVHERERYLETRDVDPYWKVLSVVFKTFAVRAPIAIVADPLNDREMSVLEKMCEELTFKKEQAIEYLQNTDPLIKEVTHDQVPSNLR